MKPHREDKLKKILRSACWQVVHTMSDRPGRRHQWNSACTILLVDMTPYIDIHSGIVWMLLDSSLSTCVRVKFSLSFTPIHSSTCGLMQFRLHRNKASIGYMQCTHVSGYVTTECMYAMQGFHNKLIIRSVSMGFHQSFMDINYANVTLYL
jgi:hypothetical protein